MYRTTPGKETPSPASLMFGRKLRTNLPARQKDFFTCHSDKVKKSHISSQSYQKRYYQGRDLPNNLKPGSDVFFKTAGEKLWQPATLVHQTDDPRSFIVQRGTKVYRRNRRHILRPSDNYQHSHSYQEPQSLIGIVVTLQPHKQHQLFQLLRMIPALILLVTNQLMSKQTTKPEVAVVLLNQNILMTFQKNKN